MNRPIALGIFILLLAIVAAVWLWASRIDPAPDVPVRSTDYATPEAWAVRPASPPAAVWQDGWAIDVFLVLDAAARSPAPLKALAARDAAAIAEATSLAGGLGAIGPVYAPVYSASDVSGEVARAFASYLAHDNRGRAFVFATDRPLPASLQRLIADDTMLSERFGGVLRLATSGDEDEIFAPFTDGLASADYCPERLAGPQGCVAAVLTARKGDRHIITNDPLAGNVVIDGFVEWLDANAVQLAEPLGDFEEIAIIDIRRPGETGAEVVTGNEPAIP